MTTSFPTLLSSDLRSVVTPCEHLRHALVPAFPPALLRAIPGEYQDDETTCRRVSRHVLAGIGRLRCGGTGRERGRGRRIPVRHRLHGRGTGLRPDRADRRVRVRAYLRRALDRKSVV